MSIHTHMCVSIRTCVYMHARMCMHAYRISVVPAVGASSCHLQQERIHERAEESKAASARMYTYT